jgi:hypothetical protein
MTRIDGRFQLFIPLWFSRPFSKIANLWNFTVCSLVEPGEADSLSTQDAQTTKYLPLPPTLYRKG